MWPGFTFLLIVIGDNYSIAPLTSAHVLSGFGLWVMCPMHTARSHTQTATHHVPPYPTAHVTVHGTLARAVATAFAPVTCHEPAPSSQGVLRTSPSSPARDTLATSKDTCPAPSSPLPPSRRHGALILSRLPRSPISDIHTSLPRLPCLRYTQATLSWSHTPSSPLHTIQGGHPFHSSFVSTQSQPPF